jgi:hypothetical protein
MELINELNRRNEITQKKIDEWTDSRRAWPELAVVTHFEISARLAEP